MKTNIHFFICPLFILRMRNFSDKICRENQNAHFMYSVTLFSEIRAVYEIMWKNFVESDRPQMIVNTAHAL